jgi:hypothetical protein
MSTSVTAIGTSRYGTGDLCLQRCGRAEHVIGARGTSQRSQKSMRLSAGDPPPAFGKREENMGPPFHCPRKNTGLQLLPDSTSDKNIFVLASHLYR